MNTEYAKLTQIHEQDGKVVGYTFTLAAFAYPETIYLDVEACKYDDGTPWAKDGLYLGFAIKRMAYMVGYADANYKWRPVEAGLQAPRPKEYETHHFAGIAFTIEKGAHWDLPTAIQVEILTVLREIKDQLKGIAEDTCAIRNNAD